VTYQKKTKIKQNQTLKHLFKDEKDLKRSICKPILHIAYS